MTLCINGMRLFRITFGITNLTMIKFKVICCFYNEQFLLPFFLSHYREADMIHALISNSTDDTNSILKSNPKVQTTFVDMPDGFDDDLKVAGINLAIEQSAAEDYDWIIVVDADEYVWPPGKPEGSLKAFLATVPAEKNYVMSQLWWVFRCNTDFCLDPSKEPIIYQRRHGAPESNRHSGNQKPCAIRNRCSLKMGVGNHSIQGPNLLHHNPRLEGVHWSMADPAFCLTRRMRDRRDRMSQANHKKGSGLHNFNVSAHEILDISLKHLDDPQLF